MVSIRGLDNIATSEGGGTDETDGESENPAANSSIARLAYTTSVLDLQVNDCGAITIQALNANNEAMTVADMTLYLSDGSAGGTFYSDASCSSGKEITSTRLVNASSVTVYYKKPAPGQITLSVMENPSQGWSNATQTGVINSNTVTKLVFTSAALNQTTNDCGSITVQAQDVSNVPVTVFGIGVVLAGAGSGGAYYSDSACTAGNEIGSVTINNANSTTYYYRKLTAGTPTLSAAENPSRAWADASQNATVVAVVSKIAFTNSALDVLTSDCTALTLETQNAGSIATNVSGGNKTIDLDDGAAGGVFYSDIAFTGGNEITSRTINNGANSSTVYYKKTTAGAVTLTAAENPSIGWTDATLSAVINASNITQLVYTTATLNQTTTDCGTVNVQAQTGGGAPVTVYGITINLASNSGGTFYSDAACTTGNEITTRTIDTANAVTYYYKKTSAGTALLTADESPSKSWTAASQTAVINAAAATKLAYTTSALAQDADDCGTITLQAQDSSSAAVTVYGVSVNLGDGAAGGTFYSDSSCTGGNEVTTRTIDSADSVTYYYKKTSAGTPTLTAAENPSRSWTDASQNATITNIITKLVLTNTALNIDTDDCAALTIETQDAGSSATNVTGGNKTIDLDDGSNGVFYSDSACTGGNQVTTRTINNGSSAVTVYYKKTTAGAVTLTAAENPNVGWTNASQAATINSENVTKLAYTTSPLTQKTSDCGTITLQAQDGSSAAVNVYNITVNLSDGAGGTFYSDSSCTGGNEITTRTINAANSVTYYYKNTSAASVTLTADETPSKGWTFASQTAAINSTAVTKLDYTTSALNQDTTTCGTITVQAQDVGSSAVTVYGVTVNLADGSNGVFYSDSACTGGNEITTRTINNANAVTYYYKKPTAGTPTITASESPDLSWTNASQNATVTAIITKLAFSNTALSQDADDCGALTIQTQDGGSTATNVSGGNKTIDLGDGAAGGTFYSDSSCTGGNEVTTRTINDGSNSVSVYYKKTSAGTPTLTAAENPSLGWSDASQGATITNIITKLVFSNTALDIDTNDCGALTIQTEDAGSSATNVTGGNKTIDLGDGAAGGVFYSDSSCTGGNEVTTRTINNGSNSVSVYYKKTTAAAVTLSAAENPDLSWTNASQAATINSENVTKLVYTTSALVQKAGDCGTITLQAQDSSNNPVNVYNITVNLGDGGVGGLFYSDNACTGGNQITTRTINAASSVTYYYKSAFLGSATLTADESPTKGWTLASQTAGINSTTVTKLDYTTSALTQDTTACGTITVQAQDNASAGVTVYGITVNLADGSNGVFYSDSSCTGGNEITTRTINNANFVTYYYKKPTAGSPTITASESPDLSWTNASQNATVTAVITKLAFSNTALSQDADDCGALTIQTQDGGSTGTNVTGGNKTINLGDGSAGGTFYSDSSCTGGNEVTTRTINDGSNSVTVYYQKTSAGTPTLTAAENPSAGWTDASQGATITSIITQLAFTNSGLDIDTNDCGALTIQTMDASFAVTNVTGGNKTIDLGDGSAGGVFYSDSSCTGGNEVTTRTINSGSNSVTVYYKRTSTGYVTLSAAENPNIGWTNASQDAVINSHLVTKLVYTTSAITQKSDDCATITIQAQNASNAGVTVYGVSVDVTDTAAGGTFYTSNTCAGGSETTGVSMDGTNSVTYYYKNSIAGSFTLAADENPSKGWTAGSLPINIQPSNITQLVYTTTALNQNTDVCGTLTVQAQDSGNNPETVYGLTLNLADGSDGVFYSDSSCTGGNEVTTRTINGTDSVTYYYKKSTAGTPTITAAENPSLGWTDASQNATINGIATISKLAFSNTALDIDSDDCGALTIQTQDASNVATNVSGNKTIDLGDGSAGGVFYSDSSCTGGNEVTTRTIADASNSVIVYYKKATAASVTLSAAENPDLGWTNASQAAVINSHTITKLAYTTVALDQDIDDCGTITVQAQDSGSSAVTAYNISVALSDGAAGGTFYSDSFCTGGNEVTTRTINSANSVTYYYKKTTAAAVTLTADENPTRGWTAASQSAVINSTAVTKLAYTTGALSQNSGVCGTITLQAQDTGSSAVTVFGISVDLSDGSAGGTFYSDSSCTGGNEITTRTLNNAHSATYYYKNLNEGTPTLTAAENPSRGWTDASQNATINSLISKIVFTSTAIHGYTDDCSSVTIRTRNASDAAENYYGASALLIDVNDGAGDGVFYSDANCSNSITQTSIPSGQSTSIVFFKKTTVGSVTLAAAENPSRSWTDGSQTATINNAAIEKIVFTNTALNQYGTDCGLLTIQFQDVSNAAYTVYDINLVLSDGANGVFYANSSCTAGTGFTTLNVNNTNTASVYYKRLNPGLYTLTADETPTRGWTLASQTASVNSDSVTKIVITNTLSTAATPTCTSVTLETQNANGGRVNVYGVTIDLTDAGAPGTFYPNNWCILGQEMTSTTLNNTYTKTVYYRTESAGAYTLTASENPSRSWTDATGQGTAYSASTISKLTIMANSYNAQPGVCNTASNIDVMTANTGGTNVNVSGAQVIELRLETLAGAAWGTLGTDYVMYSNAACSTPLPDADADGRYEATIPDADNNIIVYLRVNNAGSAVIAATATTQGWAAGYRGVQIVPTSATYTGAGSSHVLWRSDAGVTNGTTAPTSASPNMKATDRTSSAGENAPGDASFETYNADANSSYTAYMFQWSLPSGMTASQFSSVDVRIDGVGYSNWQAYYWNAGGSAWVAIGAAASGTSVVTRSVTGLANTIVTADPYVYVAGFGMENAVGARDINKIDYGTVTYNWSASTLFITKLAFTSLPTLYEGECGSVTVQTQNASSVGVNVVIDAALTLTATNAKLYSDSNCTSQITTTTIAAGTNSKTYYYMATASGTKSVGANESLETAWSSASGSATVNNLNLVLTSNIDTTVNTCNPVTFELRNDSAGAVNAPRNIPVDLLVGGGQFYSDVACTAGNEIFSTTLASATSSKTVYYQSSVNGSYALSIYENPDLGYVDISDTIDLQDSTAPVAGNSGVVSIPVPSLSENSLSLSWTKATDNSTTQANLQYQVYRSLSNDMTTVNDAETNGAIISAYTADVNSYNVSNLTPGVTYYFTVIVKDAADNKTIYQTASATTPSDTLAPAPGSTGTITTANITGGTVDLSWTPAVDNGTPQASLQYKIVRSLSSNINTVTNATNNGTLVQDFTAALTSKHVTAIDPATTHYFNIIVRDALGNMAVYTTVSVTTPASPGITVFTLANGASDGYVDTAESSSTLDLVTLTATYYDTDDFAMVTSATTCDQNVTYNFASIPKINDLGALADGSYKVCVKLVKAGFPAFYDGTNNVVLNTPTSAEAQTAADEGIDEAVTAMGSSSWEGVDSTLEDTLAVNQRYETRYVTGDPDLDSGDPDWSEYPYRVTIESYGYSGNPDYPSDLITFHARSVQRLKRRAYKTPQPSNWSSVTSKTIYQWANRSSQMQPPLRIEGPTHYGGTLFISSTYPSYAAARTRYLSDQLLMEQNAAGNVRPWAGAMELNHTTNAGATLTTVQTTMGVSTTDIAGQSTTAPLSHPGTVTDYRLYPGGKTYYLSSIQSVYGATIADLTLEPDMVANPLGVFITNGTLTIGNNVTIKGTIIADASTNEVQFAGTNVDVEAVPLPVLEDLAGVPDSTVYELPVALVKDDIRINSATETVIRGVIGNWDEFELKTGVSSTALDFMGRWFAAGVNLKGRSEWTLTSPLWTTEYNNFIAQYPTIPYFPNYVLSTRGFDPTPTLVFKEPTNGRANLWQKWWEPVYGPHAADGDALLWEEVRSENNPATSLARVVFTVNSLEAVVNACSAMTVQTRDFGGNVVNVSGGNRVVNVSTSSGAFYSDSGCANSITSTTITDGNSSSTIYLKATTTAVAPIVSASSTGLISGHAKVYINDNDTVTKLVFYSDILNQAAGVCGGVGTRAQNAESQNVVHYAFFTLSDGGAGGKFYNSTTCSEDSEIDTSEPRALGAYQYLYYMNNTPGNYVITADEVPSRGWTAATQNITITP